MFCLSLLIKTARECINIGPIKSNFQIFSAAIALKM